MGMAIQGSESAPQRAPDEPEWKPQMKTRQYPDYMYTPWHFLEDHTLIVK
jgi:hypothetical protein